MTNEGDAATVIDFWAAERDHDDAEIDVAEIDAAEIDAAEDGSDVDDGEAVGDAVGDAIVGDASERKTVPPLSVEERFGHAILRLRLYRGWSQRDLQRTSGVHQSQVSRLETGRQRGLSSRRVFAILRALRVGEVAFLPPEPAVPPTQLELMLWGDPWARAGRAAERRVNRRRSA